MEKLIEALITKIYYNYRQRYYQKVFQYAPFLTNYLSEPLIRFGGFEFNYDVYGHASHRECYLLGGTKLYEHTIYLNKLFLNLLMDDENLPFDFTFALLLKTIAHETAHCLVYDFYPSLTESHSVNHTLITQELLERLEKDVLVKKIETKLTELARKK